MKINNWNDFSKHISIIWISPIYIVIKIPACWDHGNAIIFMSFFIIGKFSIVVHLTYLKFHLSLLWARRGWCWINTVDRIDWNVSECNAMEFFEKSLLCTRYSYVVLRIKYIHKKINATWDVNCPWPVRDSTFNFITPFL